MKLSSLYNVQQAYVGEENAFVQGMFSKPPTDDPQVFLGQILTFCSDAALLEPRLITQYDEALARIDKVLQP